MFKPFFVHYSRPVRKDDNSKRRHSPRGFTAYIEPGNDPQNRTAHITVSFCSAKDEFKKSQGRTAVMIARAAQDDHPFNRRSIPDVMAQCANACAPDYKYVDQDYYYLLKYVV